MLFSTKRFLRNAAFLLSITALANLQAQAQQRGDSKVFSIEKNKIDNTIKFLGFATAAGIQSEKANEVFTTYLGIDGVDNVMKKKHNTTSKAGITVMRYTQYYKGIKVQYSGATLTVKYNLIAFVSSNYFTFQHKPTTVPVITEREAFAKAIKFVGAKLYKWELPEEEAFIKKMTKNPDTSFLPKGNLVWMDDMTDDVGDRVMRLAYCFNIYAEKPLSRQEVFIDAATGKVLFSNALIKHTSATGASRYSGTVPFTTAKPASTYILLDSTRGDGVYTLNLNNSTSYGAAIDFASATNTWPSAPTHNVALDAHWGTEKVYDYWLAEHGRRSWDDMDAPLISYVHYGTNYNNAFWNGSVMTYGDGSGSGGSGFDPLTSLDVTAHEIGHGICSATSDLVYTKESGAMNEGFSDCWAATIEHYADPHEVDAVVKKPWYIGEEIKPSAPLRRMDFPKLRTDPDTYGGTYWTAIVGCTPSPGNDYCGVHNNSGVLNKFYYLLTEGGSGTNDKGNAYAVTGLGWTKSPIILYQTEIVLTSTATFADCRTASILITETLYGTCSPEVKSVTDAWYAVGVGAAYVPCAFIGFEVISKDVTELSATTTCPASTVYNIGLKPMGSLISGGNPTVSLSVAGGTALSGRDYSISTSSLTFPAGSTATQFATLTVFDNGAVMGDKTIALAFSLNPMGSNAKVHYDYDTMAIQIFNNDSIPTLVTPIETILTSTRTWDIDKTEEVYFYNPTNNNLIAGISKPNVDLGCVTATISGAGVGFVPATFTTLNRSLKEVNVTSAFSGASTTFDFTFYLTNAELAGKNLSTLKLIKTEQPSDATVSKINATVVTPTLIMGTNYVGFTASFTGFSSSSRFFLIDDTLCSPSLVTLSPSTDVRLCVGDSVILSAFTNPGSSYQWMRDGVDITAATNSNFYAKQEGLYRVTIKNAGGCTATSTSINVSKDSVTIYNVTGGGSFCAGANGVHIGLSGSEADVIYQLYQNGIASGATKDGTGAALDLGIFATAGTYTVIGTKKGTSCKDSMKGTTTIVVLPMPIARITPSGTVIINNNSSQILNATTAVGYSYKWLLDEALIDGQTDSFYTAKISGNYKVIVSQNGCVDTSEATTVDVLDLFDLTLLPNPNDGNFGIKGKMKNAFDGVATVVISNMLGQRLFVGEAQVKKGIMDEKFALNGVLAKAMYLVKVTAGEEEFVFHLLIL